MNKKFIAGFASGNIFAVGFTYVVFKTLEKPITWGLWNHLINTSSGKYIKTLYDIVEEREPYLFDDPRLKVHEENIRFEGIIQDFNKE